MSRGRGVIPTRITGIAALAVAALPLAGPTHAIDEAPGGTDGAPAPNGPVTVYLGGDVTGVGVAAFTPWPAL